MSARAVRLLTRLAGLALAPAQSFAQAGGLIGGLDRRKQEPGQEVRPRGGEIRAATGSLTESFTTDEEPAARALALLYAPAVEQAEVGKRFSAYVTLRNTSKRWVYDVEVAIDSAFEPQENRDKLRLVSAARAPVGSAESPRPCVISDGGRVTCAIDEIAVEMPPEPGIEQGIVIRLEFEILRGARPGALRLVSRAKGSRGAAAGPIEAQIPVTADPRASVDVNLAVRVRTDGGPVPPGQRFTHQVVVRNDSPTESASGIEVLVLTRLLDHGDTGFVAAPSHVRGGVVELADGGIYQSPGTTCRKEKPGRHRCEIAELAAGAEVRIPFEWVMSADLMPTQLARFETWAQARSRERDSDPNDGRGRAYTGIVSRAPELVFLVPVRVGRGASARTASRPTDTLAPGQPFTLAAHFMDPRVMPFGPLAVELFVEPDGPSPGDGAPHALALEGAEIRGFDPSPSGLVSIYRSAERRISSDGGPGALPGPKLGRVRAVYTLPKNDLLGPATIERTVPLGP